MSLSSKSMDCQIERLFLFSCRLFFSARYSGRMALGSGSAAANRKQLENDRGREPRIGTLMICMGFNIPTRNTLAVHTWLSVTVLGLIVGGSVPQIFRYVNV